MDTNLTSEYKSSVVMTNRPLKEYPTSGGITTNTSEINLTTTTAAAASNITTADTEATQSTAISFSFPKILFLWEMNVTQIDQWLKGLVPFFPRPPKQGNVSTSSDTSQQDLQEQKQKQQHQYNEQVQMTQILLNNLLQALSSATSSSSSSSSYSYTESFNHSSEDTISMPAVKRIKMESSEDRAKDVYHILDTSFAKGTVIYTPGAILAKLSIGGLINALAGVPGGLVDVSTAKPLSKNHPHQQEQETAAKARIPTAANMTLPILQNKAISLSHIISTRLQVDMMESTPNRIREMLCPEITLQDIAHIRKRIYETVILGKGTGASERAANLEREDDLPVAARTALHEIDKFQRCKVCGNNNQSNFVLDKKNGDLICAECGTVNKESLMHEGNAFRKFEGEEDKNHHGDIANPLMSNAYNMGTTLSGVTASVGAGIGGIGSGGKHGLETILKNIHNYTEMNISQFGKDEKKTRIGYKDRQKKEAFYQMAHVADALSLHQAVLQRAKELFAGFRDDRELVQQFKGVLAACLCESFDQLSKDGRQLLKTITGASSEHGSLGSEGDASSSDHPNPQQPLQLNSRATRRSELHSSSLAGKGGLFLNTDGDKLLEHASSKTEEVPVSETEKKPASTWDMDDVRSFLLDASKVIAKQWYNQSIEQPDTTNATPKSLAELEGTLVQRALSLCNVLEHEVNAAGGSITSSGIVSNGTNHLSTNESNRHKVSTARVTDMGSLNIRWQHAHERGSGGAGGVGNNGILLRQGIKSNNSTNGGRRSAGQILILKTVKKLSEAMGDGNAGEAFHTELRRLISRQESRKKKDLRELASNQRLNQMKRKPWLQARVQDSDT